MSKIQTAVFVSSNTDVKKCPAPIFPEYAFIGRSNVGKSSLINMLVNHSGLAKTSSKPGKTTLINHFLINNSWYMVDLPGYGYAKKSKDERGAWNLNTVKYFKSRESLMNVFVLIDSRLEPQQIDLDFMEWLVDNELPFVMIFTKTDKLTANQLQKNLAHYKKEMLKYWEEMPLHFLTSSEKKEGRDAIVDFIAEVNKSFVRNA